MVDIYEKIVKKCFYSAKTQKANKILIHLMNLYLSNLGRKYSFAPSRQFLFSQLCQLTFLGGIQQVDGLNMDSPRRLHSYI